MISHTLTPGQLDLSTLRKINDSAVTLNLVDGASTQIAASAQTVQNVINKRQTVYGINTGFGLLANTKIADDELELLQQYCTFACGRYWGVHGRQHCKTNDDLKSKLFVSGLLRDTPRGDRIFYETTVQ
jgi:hypothetical protein